MWLPRVIFSVILPYIKACARHVFLLCFSLALFTAVNLLGLSKETELAVMLPICVSVFTNSFSIHEKILTKADGLTELSKTKNSHHLLKMGGQAEGTGREKAPLRAPGEIKAVTYTHQQGRKCSWTHFRESTQKHIPETDTRRAGLYRLPS